MSSSKLLQNIKQLDTSEKLVLIENIWDSIEKTPSLESIPGWHRIELDKRAREFKNNSKVKYIDWEELHSDLKSR